jgi:hypothetical protein
MLTHIRIKSGVSRNRNSRRSILISITQIINTQWKFKMKDINNIMYIYYYFF